MILRSLSSSFRAGGFGLAHQNRTIAIASDFRIDGAKSPDIRQKEGVLGSEIAARKRKSLATFHRTLKSQCSIALSCLGNRCDFWGPRWASQSQKAAKMAAMSVRALRALSIRTLLPIYIHTAQNDACAHVPPLDCPLLVGNSRQATPPVRLGLSGRNSGKIPERHRKCSQSFSWNFRREYGWDPPSPTIQGIWGFQSISRIVSPPQYGWGRLFFQNWFRRGPLRAGHGIPSSTGGISDKRLLPRTHVNACWALFRPTLRVKS